MDDERLDELIRRQRGVLAPRDAALLGMTPRALSEHGRRHQWPRPYRGVLLAPAIEITFVQAVLIAVRAAGDRRVLVSREAAAYLWDMTRKPPRVIDLVVPVGRHAPDLRDLELEVCEDGRKVRVRIRVWRSRTLKVADAADLGGIPVTTPARTILDLAAVLDVDALRCVVIDARQRRIVTLEEIRTVHARIGKYPGRPKVTRVLRDLDVQDCDSRLEWDFRKDAAARGFTPYPKPFPFRCPDGVVIEIDVAFPRQWVAGECDGLSSRADRESLTKHHKRQNLAVQGGWRPFLIDWTRLKRDPDGLFAELAALLAGADPDRPPAPMADPAEVDPRYRARRRRR